MFRKSMKPRALLGAGLTIFERRWVTLVVSAGLAFMSALGCDASSNGASLEQGVAGQDASIPTAYTDIDQGNADVSATFDAGSSFEPDTTDPFLDAGTEEADGQVPVSPAPNPSIFHGFRITTLTIASPTLCVDYDDGCVNLQANVNSILEDSFFSEEAHVDMVGQIIPPESDDGAHTLLFQDTQCERSDGAIVHCALDEAGPHFQDVVVSSAGICEPDNPGYKQDSNVMQMGPCFSTSTSSTYITIFQTPVPIEEAQILGTMVEEDGALRVEHGTIIGFISEDFAQSIPINIESFTGDEQSLTLADVLHEKARALFNDSVYGWHVVFNFNAEQVPTQ